MARTYDPFRGFDRLMGQVLTTERAAQIPMDLYRSGDHYVLAADIPGADPGSIEVNVEDRTLTIRAKRSTPSTAMFSGSARSAPPAPTHASSRSAVESTSMTSPLPTTTAS